MSTATVENPLDQASQIKWFHSIDLGNGSITPGVIDNQKILERISLPTDLTDRTVLDIGAWDGFYSFEAERRGAKRVLATDHFCWSGEGWGTKDGFNLAHRILESEVESLDIDIDEINSERLGKFDVVFFLGVLYHLRHPIQALERVADVTADLLILETAADLTQLKRPALAFYQGSELDGDPTNWFGPNEPAIHAMLKAVGFRDIQTVYRPRMGYGIRRLSRTLRGKPEGGRIVVHARK